MRYFLEVAYRGTGFAGFQVQENARTIQGEVEAALQTIFRDRLSLTGSSRTDAGVHALQNFFHVDTEAELQARHIYNVNALLPGGIALKSIRKVAADAHCRFDATSREYRYHICRGKDPFLEDRAWHFPYTVDFELLTKAARLIIPQADFSAFAKRNTQVKTFLCKVVTSEWLEVGGGLVYRVESNRFLRGMVRALVATMLRVGRGTMTLDEFSGVLEGGDNRAADFSAPPHGLFLHRVNFPPTYFL